MNIRATR